MSDIDDEMQGCSVRLCAFEYYNPYEGADDEPIDEDDEPIDEDDEPPVVDTEADCRGGWCSHPFPCDKLDAPRGADL